MDRDRDEGDRGAELGRQVVGLMPGDDLLSGYHELACEDVGR